MPRLALTLPLLALLAVAACETVDGFGRDVQGAGRVVSSGAQEVQEDLE